MHQLLLNYMIFFITLYILIFFGLRVVRILVFTSAHYATKTFQQLSLVIGISKKDFNKYEVVVEMIVSDKNSLIFDHFEL